MCYAVVVVVDITVFFIISKFVTTLRSYEFEVNNTVGGRQGHQGGGDHGGCWHQDVSLHCWNRASINRQMDFKKNFWTDIFVIGFGSQSLSLDQYKQYQKIFARISPSGFFRNHWSTLLASFSSFSILTKSWTLVLSVVTHIGAVKNLKVPNISTADHIPALIKEHSSWSDTLMDFTS